MEFAILIVVLLYVLQNVLLRMGMNRGRENPPSDGFEPVVSVVVAARNEEEHIAECLESLLQLDYPGEKLELILVNDRSTDRTPGIIADFSRGRQNLRMVTTVPEAGNLRGKANAVAQGIAASTGEVLLFTDADCRVPPEWVRKTVGLYREDVGMAAGFTLLDASSGFEGIQALDWVFLFAVASGAAGWNIPLTAIGNNFSVRRSAYDRTGGYAAIPFSVTEDYALVRAILGAGVFRLRFPVEPASMVRSRACRTWRQLFRQKQRWSVGGRDMIPMGYLIMLIGWICRAGVLALPATGGSAWFSMELLLLIGLADLLLLTKPLRILSANHYLRYFFRFECYFFLYVLLIPFIALFSGGVVWKNRRF